MHQIKRLALRAYSGLLLMYPPEFRLAFGTEMQDVFSDLLDESADSRKTKLAQMILRELFFAFVCALGEHYNGWKERKVEMEGQSLPQTSGSSRRTPSGGAGMGDTWKNAFLAGLPYLLILLGLTLPELSLLISPSMQGTPAQTILETSIVFVMVLSGLAAALAAWRQKWPVWSASWTIFVIGVLFGLVFFVLARQESISQDVIGLAPLLAALVLYRITRADRLRGLLAAMPVMYFLWLPSMESVSDQIEVPITAICLLIYAVTAMLSTRLGDWRAALGLLLAGNAAVGLQYSFAGIYYGGMLPFVAPGPSTVEVVKVFIPYYLATNVAIMGPLLARRFREIGLLSGIAGKVLYRLVLLALLGILVTHLYALYIGTSQNLFQLRLQVYPLINWAIYISLALYVVGIFLLFRAAQQNDVLPPAIDLLLLAVLPLFLPLSMDLPLIFGSTRPVIYIYAVPQIFALPQAAVMLAGLIWLGLTVWLITRDEYLPARPRLVYQAG